MKPHTILRRAVFGTATARTSRRRNFRERDDHPPSAAVASAASTSSSDSSPPQPQEHQYRYVDAAGKRKATIQDAAPSLASSSREGRAPWELGFQVPERSSALWGDDLRRRLIRHALASKFGGEDSGDGSGLVLSEEELDERLAQLARLLPGLMPRLATTSASLLARMVADPAAVAATLVGLRATFPRADIGRMVSRSPALALAGSGGSSGEKGGGGGGLAALAEARAGLSKLLPNLDVDAAVSEHPSLLDVEGVASAIEEARRVLGPQKFELSAFEKEPSRIFRFQYGELLIPYDQFEKPGG